MAPKARKEPLDRLRSKKRASLTVHVNLDPETALRVEQIERKLVHAREHRPSDVEDLEARLVEAKKDEDAVTELVVLTAPGRKAVRRLEEAHPPEEAHVKEWQDAHGTPDENDPDKIIPAKSLPPYNPDTFPDALIAACMGVEDVATLSALLDDWNESEYTQLFMAAQLVVNKTTISWGKG